MTDEQKFLDEVNKSLYGALKQMHSVHRTFSGSPLWTNLDDEARLEAELALHKYEKALLEEI